MNNIPLKNQPHILPKMALNTNKKAYTNTGMPILPSFIPASITKSTMFTKDTDATPAYNKKSKSPTPISKYGTANKTTKTYYKSGELKMEKHLDKKFGNISLYYKNGNYLFDGTILKGSATIQEGSWYYPNGQLYYCGTFNRQGYPEGDKCSLYYEDGSKKYIGKIDKLQKIEVFIPEQKKEVSQEASPRSEDEINREQAKKSLTNKKKGKTDLPEKLQFKIETGKLFLNNNKYSLIFIDPLNKKIYKNYIYTINYLFFFKET